MLNKILLLPFFLFISFYCFSQNRPPTDSETAVINKAVNAVVPIIDRFQNETWQKDGGGGDDPQDYSVQTKPDVVMGVAPFNDWHFTVKYGSDFYNNNLKPYYDKMSSGQIPINDAKAMDELEKEGQKVKLLSNIYVEVHVNEIGIPMNPIKNSAADLKIPGCYFSYKQQQDNLIGTDRNIPNSYVLVFGKWDNTKYIPNFNQYRFKFKHPLGTPYIENFVIILTGSPDHLKELLHTTDWKSINDGLTN